MVKFQFFIALSMLLALAGCGGGGGSGSASFEVTRGFATGNANFDGGLFVHGKNSGTGEEFSMALSATQKGTVTLNFGTWDIRVVGWDNVAAPFEGDVLCARQVVNFQSDNQTVQLQATSAKCNDSAFATLTSDPNQSYVQELSPFNGTKFTFKPLSVYTCGALYDPANPTQLLPSANFASLFCDQYPASFRLKAQGMKIIFNNKLPTGSPTPGISSACFPAPNNTGIFATAKRIPTKIPLTIQFFDEPDCLGDSLLTQYYFTQGFESTLSRSQRGFDALVRGTPSDTMLGLISDISRRGTTPFMTEVPLLICNTSTNTSPGQACVTLSGIPGGRDYFMQLDQNRIKIPGITCGAQSFSSVSTKISMNYCEDHDGYVVLDLYVDPNATPSNDTINFNGTNYTVTIETAGRPVDVLKNITRILGYYVGPADLPIENSLVDYGGGHEDDDGEKYDGILSNVKDILSPAVIGGIFWDLQCTTSPISSPVKKSLSFYEDGVLRTYQAIIANPPAVNAPRFIVDNNPRSLANINPFHRRIIIRELVNSVTGYQTQMVLDLACDGTDVYDLGINKRIGRLEEHRLENEDDKIRDERSVMFWNTSNPANMRFENYRYEKETDPATSIVTSVRTNIERVEKFPDGGNNNDVKYISMNYEYYYDDNMTLTTSDDSATERIHHSETDLSGTNVMQKNYGHLDLENLLAVMPQGTIFSHSWFPKLKNNEKFGGDGNLISALKVAPNGRFVQSYFDGSNIKVDHFNGSAYISQTYANSPPQLLAADISFDGTKSIVAYYMGGTNMTLYVFDGTSWSNTSASLSGGAPSNIMDIKVAILNSGEHLVIARGDDMLAYYALGNLTAPGIPTAINLTSFYNSGSDSIPSFDIAKTTTNFHVFFHHLFDDASNYSRNISHCELNLSTNNTCVTRIDRFLASGTSPAVEDIRELQAINSDDGTLVYLFFTETDSGFNPTNYHSVSSTNWGTPTVTPASNFNVMYQSNNTLTTLNLATYAAGANTAIMMPFAGFIGQGLKPSLQSLQPSKLLSPSGSPTSRVITDPATFKNIGSNL